MFLSCLVPFKGFSHDFSYGIVNFSTCVVESKYGKREQETFETIKSQMVTIIGDIEKQIDDVSSKLQDPEFVDGLSPDAERELHAKHQTLQEERDRYQNQYIQIVQQANMNLFQTMHAHVITASQAIAKQMDLSMVVREDACLFYNPSCDITIEVIKEMDKIFDEDNPSTIPPATE